MAAFRSANANAKDFRGFSLFNSQEVNNRHQYYLKCFIETGNCPTSLRRS